MKQQCYLAMVWLTWLGLPLLAVVVALRIGLVAGLPIALAAAVFVLLVGIVGQVLYIRWFPHVSRWLGYGSVADAPADPASMPQQLLRVKLYTANVCPFCPIVKRRLSDLQRLRPFELEEIDVTFRPEIIRSKGLRSVPVLESNGQLLVGNATSKQIADFLTAAANVHTAG
jgi:glutaredoxin